MSNYYNIEPILQRDSTYNVIFGEKSNGKSYALKNRILFPEFIETGGQFVIIRRSKDEMKKSDMERYFEDVNLDKKYKGMYDKIVCKSSNIYFAKYNQKGQLKTTVLVGYVIPLSCEQKFSSQVFNDVTNIVFEEFVSRSGYLYDEINSKFMYLISTIARRRKNVKVWLLGNTISRICPYFSYFGIDLKTFVQGDLKSYDMPVRYRNKEYTINVSAEYCKHSEQDSESIVLGNVNNINGGEWVASEQQKLSYNYKLDNLCYRLLFIFDGGFNYVAEYRYNKKNNALYWFIYPKTRPLIIKKLHIITNILNIEPHYLISTLIEPIIPYEKECLRDLIVEKMYFSTNLCGEEFKKFFPKLKRRYIY